jgi:hypothetical protein
MGGFTPVRSRRVERRAIMNDRSKKLRRKLRRCAGLTGSGTLIAAASLGLTSKGHAEIVTLQLNNHISGNSQVSYDLDGDGELDVTFFVGSGFPFLSLAGARLRAEILNVGCTYGICGRVIRYDSLGYSLVQPHQAGDTISCPLDVICSWPESEGSWLAIEGSGPFLDPTSPRYAGFSFMKIVPVPIDTLVFNAWAELAVTEPQTGEYELDVIAIGYESEPGMPVPAGGIVTAAPENMPPAAGLLLQNTPNPFNRQTRIMFQLPTEGMASIRIYDAAGRLVRTINRGHAQKGLNTVGWDGRDDGGRRVSAGVYFCRLEALGLTREHKMILVE